MLPEMVQVPLGGVVTLRAEKSRWPAQSVVDYSTTCGRQGDLSKVELFRATCSVAGPKNTKMAALRSMTAGRSVERGLRILLLVTKRLTDRGRLQRAYYGVQCQSCQVRAAEAALEE